MAYRISRNCEASIIDKIVSDLSTDGWTGIEVLKGFPQEYKGKTPFIGVEALKKPIKKREIGSTSFFNNIIITIRIFATSDGQRLDLADWMIEKLVPGLSYYTYIITNGAVSSKILAGRVNVSTIIDNRKELQNMEKLESEDRYRHIITMEARIAIK